jgi:hypothetical protein
MGGVVWGKGDGGVGNYAVQNDSKVVVNASSLTFVILMNAKNWYGSKDSGLKWESELMNRLKNITNVYPNNIFEWYASGMFTIEQGVSDMIIQIYYGLAVGVLICTVFNIVIFSDWIRHRDLVKSQLTLLVYTTLTVGLSTVSAIGALGWMGVPWSNEIPLCVFLCVSIGFDDAYLITFDFNRYDPNLGNQERIAKTMKICGTTITLTSITDVLAFIGGSGCGFLTSFPVMTNLCWYGAMCVLFLWIYVITLFCAFLSLDARRQSSDRYDILCCFRRKITKQQVTSGGPPRKENVRNAKKKLKSSVGRSRKIPLQANSKVEENTPKSPLTCANNNPVVEFNVIPQSKSRKDGEPSISVIDLEQVTDEEDEDLHSTISLGPDLPDSGADNSVNKIKKESGEKYKLSTLTEGWQYTPGESSQLTAGEGDKDLATDNRNRNDCMGNLLGKVIDVILR